MNGKSLTALIVLNVVLLGGLLLTAASEPAYAAGARSGDYAMIAGETRGRTGEEVIYIIEQRSSRMAALIYRSANQTWETLGGRIIANDIRQAAGTRNQ